jgi:hypothetical protein
MDWCEKNGVEYVFSLTKNAVLATQIFARTDEVCVKRAIGNLDVVRDRFPEPRSTGKASTNDAVCLIRAIHAGAARRSG